MIAPIAKPSAAPQNRSLPPRASETALAGISGSRVPALNCGGLAPDVRRRGATVARGVGQRCQDCGAAPERMDMLHGVDEARSVRAVRTVRLV
jgi:hypothetical protein